MEKLIVQRGWKRTCTNYIRVVLEKNFDVKVITSNKHEGYIDYAKLVDRTCGLQEPWPKEPRFAGWGRPHLGISSDDEFVPWIDESQSGHPHTIDAEYIRAAAFSNDLAHVVCIKNPVSWLFGSTDRLKLIENAMSIDGVDFRGDDHAWKQTIEAFNFRYEKWAILLKNHPGNTFIARHEDFISNFRGSMNSICAHLGLRKRLYDCGTVFVAPGYPSYLDEDRVVLPQHQGVLHFSDRIFNKADFQDNSWIKRLNLEIEVGPQSERDSCSKIVGLLRDVVDWDLMENVYGYKKEEAMAMLDMIKT